MDKIIFTYRVTHDTGFALCVDKGILTLACCKGGTETVKRGLRYFIGRFFEENLQEIAKVYVSGIYDNKLLYIAKIDKAITMEEYFCNEEYKGRLDQIYRLNGEKLERDPQKLKGVHDNEHSNKCDINGKYVLISNEFVYFGRDAIKVDGDILKYYPKNRGQLPKGQHSYTPADVLTDENKKNSEELHKMLEKTIKEYGKTLTDGKIAEPNNQKERSNGCGVCEKNTKSNKGCGVCGKE